MQRKIVDIYEYMPVLIELIEQGKEVPLTITGNSMSPFMIHERDRILMKKPDRPWKKGDMAFFRRVNGAYVMHRICRIDCEGNCYFVGDGQYVIEGPIKQEQIFARITAVNRKGKWIRPGDFWWEFFEHIWLHMIPVRMILIKLYGKIAGLFVN